jgi:hypothetical protein
MVTPPGPRELPGLHSMGYALAADVESYRGHRLVHHGGNLHGFCSDVYLAPDDGHAVVVLANANASGISTALPLAVLDWLYELADEPWGERLLELMAAVKGGIKEAGEHHRASAAGRPPSRPLADYAGTYEHPAYDVLELRVEGDRLLPSWHDLETLELRHRDYDTWDLALGGPYEDTTVPLVARFGPDGITGVEVALEPAVDPIFFQRRPPTLSDAELRRLTGRYVMGPLALTVSVSDGTLLAAVSGAPPVRLAARDATHFELPGSSTRVEFVLVNGEVEQVALLPMGVFRPA